MNCEIVVPDWPLEDKVRALTTTRKGGCSSPPFDECNLALHVGDNAENVLENRSRLRKTLGLPDEPKWLRQRHGNVVADAATIEPDVVDADAAFTTQPKIVCAVLTADCLPIVLSDDQGTCVGVVHVGWRGLLAGVIEKTIDRMNEFTKPEYAWLGPAIGPRAFEVGEDVFELYLRLNERMHDALTPAGSGKWKLNIYKAAKIVLTMADTNNIYGGSYCTYTDDRRFFSYRRNAKTGRIATLIWIP